jgi:glycosyltransferase involved in cell wall biosynthesis
MQKSLAMFVSAPVIEAARGTLVLDKKFVSGMALHVQHWSGPVTCFIRRGATDIPFGARYDIGDLNFQVRILEPEERISAEHLADFDLALLSGDSYLDLLPPQVIRRAKSAVVYSIEYTHQTRMQIISLDDTRSLPRKIYGMAWTVMQEYKRKRAFRAARGIQANGYPAHTAYRNMGGSQILYLDNRMKPGMFATPAEMSARKRHLVSGEPLRLIHSGRLEPMKGSQDLVPIARLLNEQGVDFTLTIYGEGSLAGEIAADIRKHWLQDCVFLKDPVDFERELVPLTRTGADIFLSCHRQSDPSCTYIETMGCGVPIAGYANDMWSALMVESKAGWIAPLGDIRAMADRIAALDRDRPSIPERGENALRFAKGWDFESQFRKRMEHLENLTRH